LFGGVSGITAAYLGLGVWSLIIQQLVDSALYSIQIWIQSKWKPQLVFSLERIKVLFSFGSRIMIERVLSSIYQNFYEVMIGRNFSTADVGQYSIAKKINQIPIKNISNTLSSVTYPILSGIQDQDIRLKNAYKQIIRLAFFTVTPVMVLLIIIAEPLFNLVLSDTWLPAVPYFQWLCVGAVLYPVQLYNLNILKVKGRSDLFLNIGIVKKVIGVSGILFFVQYSVMALVIFKSANAFVAYFINSFYSGRLINYGVFEQLKDIWKFIGASTIAGVTTFLIVEFFQLPQVLTIILATLLISLIYLLLIRISEREILSLSKELFQTARKKIS
ncbi:MAG: oligosaccharide flippase family protein, partial [Balneolaceae bacterium]|nr:oligosaccharide flippase family protein [Balneolaceae bacterium]